MGQSFLGRIKPYKEKMFPAGGRHILETAADLGFIIYLFLLGVNIDLSLVRKVEKYAVVIGASGFLIPLGIGLLTMYIISITMELDSLTLSSLPFMASITAISSFPVITSLLTDLKILNSEIGRIATLASFVSDLINYGLSIVFGGVAMYVLSKKFAIIMSVVCALAFLLIILFVLRPLVTCVTRRVPEGHMMKESHFIIIAVLVLICGLGAEVLGQPAGLGTFILGVVIKDSSGGLCSKMETFSTALLVPAKFVISGLTFDVSSIKSISGATYALVLFVGYTSKFIAVFIPSLYYKLPTRDAAALALIMCCKGAIEAALYITLYEDGVSTLFFLCCTGQIKVKSLRFE